MQFENLLVFCNPLLGLCIIHNNLSTTLEIETPKVDLHISSLFLLMKKDNKSIFA